MAKFTANVPLKIKLPAFFEIDGAAGATHRIPDALVEEFLRDQVPLIPGGVTWISQDETSGIPSLPISQANVSNLTSDLSTLTTNVAANSSSLAGKYDKTGGTISGAVTATGAIVGQSSISAVGAINGASVSAATILADNATVTAARFKGGPWHDVKAYGAVGDGSTDDTTAIQAAITAAIAAGGIVHMPIGSYKISAPLDFSAMKGVMKGVRLQGSGAGDVNAGDGAATVILNTASTPAIKAYGTLAGATNQGIAGLDLCGFMVKNTANLGTNYTIDLDYVIGMSRIADVYVWGQNFTGNGLQLRNFGHGQMTIDRVQVREFRTGTGIRLAVETTPNVDVAPNSGNVALNACVAFDVLKGYHITGSNLLNSGALIACKAVNVTDVSASVGFHLGTLATSWALVAPHSERFSTGYWLDNAQMCAIYSPYAGFPTGTPDANSAGVRFSSTATGCTVIGAQLNQTHYGVSFEDSSRTNIAFGSDHTGSRVLTSWSRDVSTNASNHVLKAEGEAPFAYTMGATKLSVAKGAVTGLVNPSSLSASVQNWNVGAGIATAGLIRITANSAWSIGGLLAGTAGDELTLLNVSAFTITLNHEDSGSTATNRFFCPASTNLAIRSNGGVRIFYDTGGRWRVVAI